MASGFGRVHSGTVLRIYNRNGKSSCGYIRDDGPDNRDYMFYDDLGIFRDGDRVVFRAMPGRPNPLAARVRQECELNEIALQFLL